MRKSVALLLVLALLFSLCACGKQNATEPSSSSSVTEGQEDVFPVAELLAYQAHMLSMQLGMSVQSDYIQSLDASQEMLGRMKMFSIAVNSTPTITKILRKAGQNFMDTLVSTVTQASSSTAIAVSNLLSYQTSFACPTAPENPMAIFLQYTDRCSIVVYFEPTDSGLVTAKVYPIPPKARSNISNKLFASAKSFNANTTLNMFERVNKLSVAAKTTGQETNATYYTALAQAVFADAKVLDKSDIAPFAPDDAVAADLATYSKLLADGFRSAQVYDVTDAIHTQAEELVGEGLYAKELKHWSRMRTALALPSQFCKESGSHTLNVNSILIQALNTNPLGISANENEKIVLVVLELSEDISVFLCIYPTVNHTYLYSFACVPVPYSQAQAMATNAGAIAIR